MTAVKKAAVWAIVALVLLSLVGIDLFYALQP
jgi:hypothetical protein